jgi:hypothetical protein
VIHEVDEALRALVERDVLHGSGVEVVFDAPTKDWAARRTTPTIDCYLYDLREDKTRRVAGEVAVRDDDGIVQVRRRPPRFFRLAYLFTAWTQRPEDEHRLLSALLAVFVRSDVLPPELLVGTLADLGLPVPLLVGQPAGSDRQIPEVWSALGGELKPSLDVVVLAPIVPGVAVPAGPPVTGGTRLSVLGTGGQAETRRSTVSPARAEEGAGGARGARLGGRRAPSRG